MFCSLVHVLVKTKAMPFMVGKLFFKIEALSFQIFIKYFKFIKFGVFLFFLTDVFFDFQFCEYRILDFMEVEHIILKQSLSINITFYMKHTKVQYSQSFSDTLWSEDDSCHIWERWKIKHRRNQVYSTRYISFFRIRTHLYTWRRNDRYHLFDHSMNIQGSFLFWYQTTFWWILWFC